MRSPTQRVLEPGDVARYVRVSFGDGCRVVECGPMAAGTYAAVWWARLEDGRSVVLKVGPPPEVPLLRYEAGLVAAEARYFRLVAAEAPGVPVPPVLYEGDDFLVTGLLPGTPLSELPPGTDDAPVREAFGAACAAMHAVTGDRFGFDGDRAHGATWREAFGRMIGAILDDAADWHVELPLPAGDIRDLVERNGDVLDAVRRPALVYFDGWDGNVLAQPGPESADGPAGVDGPLRLSGIVDGERYLFGDPVMDFVSPMIYGRAEEEQDHPFVRGYGGLRFDASVCRRLQLYRLHMYLLMTVEMPSRAITRHDQPERYAWLARVLDRELTALA